VGVLVFFVVFFMWFLPLFFLVRQLTRTGHVNRDFAENALNVCA
jgi:hypothetical protein